MLGLPIQRLGFETVEQFDHAHPCRQLRWRDAFDLAPSPDHARVVNRSEVLGQDRVDEFFDLPALFLCGDVRPDDDLCIHLFGTIDPDKAVRVEFDHDRFRRRGLLERVHGIQSPLESLADNTSQPQWLRRVVVWRDDSGGTGNRTPQRRIESLAGRQSRPQLGQLNPQPLGTGFDLLLPIGPCPPDSFGRGLRQLALLGKCALSEETIQGLSRGEPIATY